MPGNLKKIVRSWIRLQPRLIFPLWWSVRQKVAVATLCTLCEGTYHRVWEYTQSGDGRFLAFIPSWWKISPGWSGWGGGGVHAHPVSLYLPLRTKLQCTLGWVQTHTPYFISTPICTLWYIPSGLVWQERDGSFELLWVEKFAKLLTEIAVCKYMEEEAHFSQISYL